MSSDKESVALEILRLLFEAWARRNERRAAGESGSLMFWNDGMLNELEKIAESGPTDELIRNLKGKFDESASDVGVIMDRLREARDKLAGTGSGTGIRIAREIDDALN